LVVLSGWIRHELPAGWLRGFPDCGWGFMMIDRIAGQLALLEF
jgi:hypothetical protein